MKFQTQYKGKAKTISWKSKDIPICRLRWVDQELKRLTRFLLYDINYCLERAKAE